MRFCAQAVAGQEPVPELLVARSHSAHPCDCALPWMLSTALQVRAHVQGAGCERMRGHVQVTYDLQANEVCVCVLARLRTCVCVQASEQAC